MCGDFNTRVGVLDEDSSLWQGVLGRHGKSERNLAGHELLECHQQPIHYEQLVSEERNTSGCLDSFCNREVSCDRLCGDESRDVRVMRGENCWTDHMLVKAKLIVVVTRFTSRNVKTCLPFAVHELSTGARREEYRELLELQLQDGPHSDSETSEQNWETLKHCIVTAAEECVGRGR